MSTKHQRFETNGTSALKKQDSTYDVFVKPAFSQARETTPIISFKKSREQQAYSSSDEFFDYIRSSEPTQSISRTILNRLKTNKILGGLFGKQKVDNRYSREDVLIFAKGFSVTGFTALVLILFGI